MESAAFRPKSSEYCRASSGVSSLAVAAFGGLLQDRVVGVLRELRAFSAVCKTHAKMIAARQRH